MRVYRGTVFKIVELSVTFIRSFYIVYTYTEKIHEILQITIKIVSRERVNYDGLNTEFARYYRKIYLSPLNLEYAQ